MGEYALYKGREIKVGTCEEMLYIRHAQRHLVSKIPNNIDLSIDYDGLFFRFPFPYEDNKDLGDLGDAPNIVVPNYYGLRDLKHQSVQFRALNGYLTSLPCPESKEAEPYKFHKNGYGGAVQVDSQKTVGDKLFLVVRCGGCRNMYSCDEEDALEIANCFINQSLTNRDSLYRKIFNHQIAWRIMDGYRPTTNPIPTEIQLTGWEIKWHLREDYGYIADYINGDWLLTEKRADSPTTEEKLTEHTLFLLNLLRKYETTHASMEQVSTIPTNPEIPTA